MGGSESKNTTKLQLLESTYLWQVKGYSDISPSKPKVSAPVEMQGDFYLIEIHNDVMENLEIKLRQKKPSDSTKKFRCVLAFLDHRGIQHYYHTKDVEIGKEMDTVVILSVPKTYLEDEMSNLVISDGFVLKFKISDSSGYADESVPDINSDVETLSSDLGKLYSKQTNYDVKIRADTATYFKAHRLILSARSPVFAAMFRHGTTECHKGLVDIPDIDSQILSSLFMYIYTGKLHGLDSNSATSLIAVANKYDLQEMKNACLEYLISNLTMDNICDAVVLSGMLDFSPLKKKICSFISKNTAEVIQSEKWKEVENQFPEVTNSVLATLLVSAKETAK